MTRLIDAEAFENYMFLEWKDGNISRYDFEFIKKALEKQPTVGELTEYEKVKEYCKKRQLVLLTEELYNLMKRNWSLVHSWMPVKVCLPMDDKESVLISGVRDGLYVARHFEGDSFYIPSSGKVLKAVGWMPLPDPMRKVSK